MHGLAEDIVRMGNQIARQFRHLPKEDAVDAVTAHLRNFWAPQMRAGLVNLVDAGDADLDPLLLEAAARFRPS